MYRHGRREGAEGADGAAATQAPGKRTLTQALQRRSAMEPAADEPAAARTSGPADDPFWFADQGVSGAGGELPHHDAIQRSFGRHDVGGISAHVGGAAADAAGALGAEAYATGNQVAFAHAPDLHTAAHEAAHVVQQRGGVQLLGGIGEVGDAYERHADEVADRVVRGESAERLLDAHAPVDAAHGGTRAVQRRMGMEMEVGRRATTAGGANLVGDTKLLDHPYFTLVSDKRPGYTNLEFVMKVFDQLAGTEQQALAALTTRLDAMKVFYDNLYASDDTRSFGAMPNVGTGQDDLYRPLPKDPENAPDGPTWADALVAPKMGDEPALPGDDAGDKKGKLFCHFTVGYPIEKMYDVMTMLGGRDGNQVHNTYAAGPRARAGEATALADTILAKDWAANLSGGEKAQLRGAMALLYTQVAAFAIKTRGGPQGAEMPGQIKNLTPALSRVTLHDIFGVLDPDVRTALRDNAEDVIGEIADQLDGTANFNDDDEREMGDLDAVTLGDYARSGLGSGADVSQERVFGGMNETGIDVSHQQNLIPIEIRAFRKQLMSFDEVRLAGADLVRESRALLLPQQQQQQQQPQQQQPQQQQPQQQMIVAPQQLQQIGNLIAQALVGAPENPIKKRKTEL